MRGRIHSDDNIIYENEVLLPKRERPEREGEGEMDIGMVEMFLEGIYEIAKCLEKN